jgi:hypothetical protein
MKFPYLAKESILGIVGFVFVLAVIGFSGWDAERRADLRRLARAESCAQLCIDRGGTHSSEPVQIGFGAWQNRCLCNNGWWVVVP